MVLAQEDSVDLSTRIDLDGHVFDSFVYGQLESGKEGNLAIRGTFGIEQAFGLDASNDAISWDDLDAVLGVPVGCGMVMVTVGLLGDVLWAGLWEWLWEGLWDVLWLGICWQCLWGEQLEQHPQCLL